MSRSCQPTGPICFHQSMNWGCQASSARCRRLSLDRLTLLGIFSSVSTAVMVPPQRFALLRAPPEVGLARSGPLPLELRPLGLAVQGERAVLAGRVGAGEDPVLPGRQAAEDLGLQGLGADEPERLLHAGQRIGRQRRALLDGDAELVGEVDVVGRDRRDAELLGLLRRDRSLAAARQDLLGAAGLAVEPR